MLHQTAATVTLLVVGSISLTAEMTPRLQTKGKFSAAATLQQAYDDNILMVSGEGMPSEGSWSTSVGARLAWDLQRASGDQAHALSLSYAPETKRYWTARSEDFDAHRLVAAGKFHRDSWSGSIESSLTGIAGSEVAPYYSSITHDDQRNAYSTAFARDRRRQIQARGKASIALNRPGWFGRAVVSWVSLDMDTDWRAEPGYQNYIDRSDVNGGGDFGWKTPAGVALTAGYRHGYQSQQALPTCIDRTQATASVGYDRFLIGVEGAPAKWLNFSCQVGPEKRTYPIDSASRTLLLAEREMTTWYAEAGAVATVTRNGRGSLKFKRWMWLSSTGKVPLFDYSFDASYRHTYSRYTIDLGYTLAGSDYRCAKGAAALRHDQMHSVRIGVSIKASPQMSFAFGASQELGRNALAGLAALAPSQLPNMREFAHRLFTATTNYQF